MTDPIFSLCYTTVRPEAVLEVLNRWLLRAAKPENVELIICYDEGDAATQAAIDALPSFPGNAGIKTVVNTGPKNCVSGWNTAALQTVGDIIIAVTDDFDCPKNWDKALTDVNAPGWWTQECVVWVKDGYNPDLFTLSILTRKRYDRFGYLFYPGYQSLFCLPPDTPVYMANQTFKAIRDVKVGDSVVGSVRRTGRLSVKGQKREFLAPSTVTATHRKIDDLVKLTLASGKIVTCTPDHAWAYYGDTRSYQRDTDNKILRSEGGWARQKSNGQFLYAPPKLGRKMVKVLEMPSEPPSDEKSLRDLGWLAGMYDGEGSFPRICQSIEKNPETCAELDRCLTSLGFQFSVRDYDVEWKGNKTRQHEYMLTGGRAEYLKFLSWTRPVRTFEKQLTKRMFTGRFGTPDEIISIEPAGRSEVYCITTETGNFVANGYLSHNCDTEYTYVAAQDRVVIDARHLLFEHMHPDCGKRQRDAADLKHASQERWTFGETLFNFRRALGFPVDDGPRAAEWSMLPVRYAVVVQAIRDDLCLEDVCRRIIDEGIRLRQTTEHGDRIGRLILFAPDQQWDGTPAIASALEDVKQIAKRLGTWVNEKYPGADVAVEFKPFRVKDVADTTKERIMIETGCRNWYQRYCLELGYQHCIIMDGDELWKPGLISRMNELVRERWPTSVFTGMIPVAGLPGYPIEGALDKATIYARADARFEHCRGAFGYRHELPGHDIYHFSATRKTLEEIAGKHLGSGHADDPAYQMKQWVQDTLMVGRIKPGARDVHMHRVSHSPNVWPLVRAWRQDELAELPSGVLQYLGK